MKTLDVTDNARVLNKIIKEMFQNDELLFDKLIQYCVQDISNPNAYGGARNSGIKYFIIHRMTYILYCCLYMGDKVNDNTTTTTTSHSKKHDEWMKKLMDFGQFMWDFSIYTLCYPSDLGANSDIRINESFYISVFSKYKDLCFNYNKYL